MVLKSLQVTLCDGGSWFLSRIMLAKSSSRAPAGSSGSTMKASMSLITKMSASPYAMVRRSINDARFLGGLITSCCWIVGRMIATS